MLAIRLQRVGRKGYPVYRIAVQEAQRHPSSGRVVAYVGTFNPHTKEANVQKEAAQKYLDNGAQPTPRVVKLLKDSGVTLPKWVNEQTSDKKKSIKNQEKLRKNRPVEEAPVDEPTVSPEAEAPAEEPATEAPAAEEATEPAKEEEAPEAPAEEAPASEEEKSE